jgi:hypothetical protein
VPTPLASIPLQSGSSPFTFIFFSGLLAWGLHTATKTNNQTLLYGCIITEIALCIITGLVSKNTAIQMVLYGGQAGELYLGALAILSFYLKPPVSWNWPKNRFLALGLGAVSYVRGGMEWLTIQATHTGLPMGGVGDGGAVGEALAGSNYQSDGDLDRLIREFGWTPDYIVSVYVQTFWITTFLLVMAWLAIWYSRRPGSQQNSSTSYGNFSR